MSEEIQYRMERDSFGDIQVPADKYYGANTARSLIYFNIGGPNERMPVRTFTFSLYLCNSFHLIFKIQKD
jgi:fumarate hydratase class II